MKDHHRHQINRRNMYKFLIEKNIFILLNKN